MGAGTAGTGGRISSAGIGAGTVAVAAGGTAGEVAAVGTGGTAGLGAAAGVGPTVEGRAVAVGAGLIGGVGDPIAAGAASAAGPEAGTSTGPCARVTAVRTWTPDGQGAGSQTTPESGDTTIVGGSGAWARTIGEDKTHAYAANAHRQLAACPRAARRLTARVCPLPGRGAGHSWACSRTMSARMGRRDSEYD